MAVAAPLIASVVPSKLFVDKSRCRSFSDGVCVDQVSEPVEFALTPADAQPVEPRLSVTGVPTYDSAGEIYFVTVREPPLNLLDWFVTRHNPAARFRSYREKYGDQTPQQQVNSGRQQMRTAKQTAEFVALKAAGYPVELTFGDVIIDFLLCLEANAAGDECVRYAPADVLLDPGDVLKKVGGETVSTIDDLGPILARYGPGDEVAVEFERNGTAMSGTIETILAPAEETPRTIIGFRPVDTSEVVLPDGISVDIDTESIGGPSAGLAFTLTLLDELTEGDLMGGQRVAVTGTIDINGNVGAIGGLNSKASAVSQVGVKYFLVPTNQGEDGPDGLQQARRVVGDDVEIIPVATLAEALAALQRIGGDPFEPAAPPDTTV